MRQKLVEVRIVAEVAALGELRGDVLQVGGCDAVREQGRLEPVERVEEIVPAPHRATAPLGRIPLPLQRQERVDRRERRRRAGARGLRRRRFRRRGRSRGLPPGGAAARPRRAPRQAWDRCAWRDCRPAGLTRRKSTGSSCRGPAEPDARNRPPLAPARERAQFLQSVRALRHLARGWHWPVRGDDARFPVPAPAVLRRAHALRRAGAALSGARPVADQGSRRRRGRAPEPARRLRPRRRPQRHRRHAQQHALHQAVAAGDARAPRRQHPRRERCAPPTSPP